MQDNMEDKQKELEDKLNEQVGSAKPEPEPQPQKPIGYGEGITINGGVAIDGNVTTINISGDGTPITINLMLPCPAIAPLAAGACLPIYIDSISAAPTRLVLVKMAQKGRLALRQITRKFSAILSKSRQISRNAKSSPNPPQPQQSRHFHPNPFSSLIPPYIPLLHI